MAEIAKPKRLTDMPLGKLAGCLLFMLWLVSMCMFDTNACTSFPLVVGMGVIALLALSCLAAGGRVVRFTWLNWVSLLIGVYFLVRCLCSYSVVESWRESIIIMGCFLFYVAGILAAQSRSASWVLWCIVIAAVLNLAAFCILRDPDIPIEWTGRPAYGFVGANNKPVSLLIYKNSAGAFFALSSALLIGCCLWGELRRVLKAGLVAVALVSCYASLHCGTRDVYALYPALAVALWFLHVVNVMYSERKVGILSVGVGVLFLCGLCVAMYELFFSGELYNYLGSIDTHLRGRVWKEICRLAPYAPLWGGGVSASQWEIVPYYNEWCIPNYAHNEYLQAWMDYGLLGIGAVLFILIAHFVAAFRVLSSELIAQERRLLTSFAAIALMVVAICAIADFPWHSYALATLSAFSCGVMASPAPVMPVVSRRSIAQPKACVRPASRRGTGVMALLCVGVVGASVVLSSRLFEPWLKQWEFSSLTKAGRDEDSSLRHALLADLLPAYPSPALMDCYYTLPVRGIAWKEQERLLKIALAANPRQLFMVNLLCDALDRQGKFEESEKLFRSNYAGDGMEGNMLNNWPANYVSHLLLWGRSALNSGNEELGYSLLDYAFNIHCHNHVSFTTPYGRTEAPWQNDGGVKPWINDALVAANLDAMVLRQKGVAMDESWQNPYAEGEKPALYQRWGKDTPERRKNMVQWMKFSNPDKKNDK